MKTINAKEVMGVVDHSSLNTFVSQEDIGKLIDEAAALSTHSVCIEPIHALFAHEYIRSRKLHLKVNVVLDFPLGALTTEARLNLLNLFSETAEEADYVTQIGYLKSGRFDLIERDLSQLVKEAHDLGVVIKIITEDAYTTLAEKKKLYRIVCKSGADFIKTTTGFDTSPSSLNYSGSLGNRTGAQPDNVKLMADIASELNPDIGIKVAGGIKTLAQALSLNEASGRAFDPKRFRLGISGTRAIYNELVQTHLASKKNRRKDSLTEK